MGRLDGEARGERFADELYALVHRLGPPEMDIHQRDAMANYLLESAVEWVRAANRRTALENPDA